MLSEAELVRLAETTQPPSGHDDSEIERAKAKNPNALNGSEVRWRHYQPWLKHRAGYELRPRYHPDWRVPQCAGDFDREDCLEGCSEVGIDAIRISDGLRVYLKIIKNDDVHLTELEIFRFLDSDTLRRDPRNHTVPLLDVISLPNSGQLLLVMPLLCWWGVPDFDTVGEAVDFFQQIVEGIQFMHEHNIAHGDCTYNNIMYDGTPMYPDGFHPADLFRRRNLTLDAKARHFTRTQRPVRYYLIDFGLSVQCKDKSARVLPVRGGGMVPPEFGPEVIASDTPQDPFPTDVWYLGAFIREQFLEGYAGLNFMEKLVADMVKDNPVDRPTMDDVMARFQELVAKLRPWTLRRPIKSRLWMSLLPIPAPVRVVMTIPVAFRAMRYILSRTPAIPVMPTPPLDGSVA
ncbi:hypothetical protein PENSPDRAFT_681919 [Peniophora sp. CONT]|nr:hypothetical protein PENSPDRAFT_681919 [Peniophora sp. CONT]